MAAAGGQGEGGRRAQCVCVWGGVVSLSYLGRMGPFAELGRQTLEACESWPHFQPGGATLPVEHLPELGHSSTRAY